MNFRVTILTLALALVASVSFANTVQPVDNLQDAIEIEGVEIFELDVTADADECTVTATVGIPGGTKVEISSTKETCAEAVEDVADGIEAVGDLMGL